MCRPEFEAWHITQKNPSTARFDTAFFHDNVNTVGPNTEQCLALVSPYYMKMSQLHLLIHLNELNELWKMLIFFTGAFCVPRPSGNGKNTFPKLDRL